MKKVRVTGANLQLRAVVDDGEHLSEIQLQPINISAKDLETYAVTKMKADLAELEEKLNKDDEEVKKKEVKKKEVKETK